MIAITLVTLRFLSAISMFPRELLPGGGNEQTYPTRGLPNHDLLRDVCRTGGSAHASRMGRAMWWGVAIVAALVVVTAVLHFMGASDVATFIVALAALSGLAWLVSAATEA